MESQGENAGKQGGNVGNGGGNVVNAENVGNQGGNAGNQVGSLRESSCLLLWLISRSARGTSHQPAFMGSCLIISQMLQPCLLSSSSVLRPCVLWPLIIGLMVVLLTFF